MFAEPGHALVGAGLGVVSVSFAMVVPTQELQIVEIGRAVVRRGPVPDVMGFAAIGRLFATGCLAVPVAYDERLPLRRGRGPGRPAHVEDLRCAEHDDAADVAIAHD